MSEEEKRKKVLEMWEKEQLANECIRQFLKYREAKEYIDELEDKIDKIKNIYTSMQFSAPENMYIFIEKLGNILRGEEDERSK